ncbi:hypothetical protein FRB96_001349 [Tulasnella sp. 330]|nr:hypothetical protein FRB96_001349 [Tulasnella sp. 330]KAG8872208.1 hypothetical protein FRB97_007879 [Tulasnella sp. 331]
MLLLHKTTFGLIALQCLAARVLSAPLSKSSALGRRMFDSLREKIIAENTTLNNQGRQPESIGGNDDGGLELKEFHLASRTRSHNTIDECPFSDYAGLYSVNDRVDILEWASKKLTSENGFSSLAAIGCMAPEELTKEVARHAKLKPYGDKIIAPLKEAAEKIVFAQYLSSYNHFVVRGSVRLLSQMIKDGGFDIGLGVEVAVGILEETQYGRVEFAQ